jgi:hypothetical protein
MSIVGWIATIALVGYLLLALASGLHHSEKVRLDYGGNIYLEKSSLWGLSKSNQKIRLLNTAAWDKGRTAALQIPTGYDWYVQGKSGDWWPFVIESFDFYDGPEAWE